MFCQIIDLPTFLSNSTAAEEIILVRPNWPIEGVHGIRP